METAAPWKPWKTNCMFSTVPTALGKLSFRFAPFRVSHSSHSPYGYFIFFKEKKAESRLD